MKIKIFNKNGLIIALFFQIILTMFYPIPALCILIGFFLGYKSFKSLNSWEENRKKNKTMNYNVYLLNRAKVLRDELKELGIENLEKNKKED